ncbi:MAG TPA: hypothetical protein VII72_09265 [Myxococcota bacterium]|jgi:hypothetical protein
MRFLRYLVLLCLVSLCFAACQRSEAPEAAPPPAAAPAPAPAPFRVSGIDLGNAIGADKRVAAPGSSFAATDTIYASVATEGASPSVTLVARWTYQDGQLVSEETQTIAPTGAAVTEFHIAKPDGWPAGGYQVEVIANGASAGTRAFQVQ